jgi:hypothetical protein
MAQRNLRTLSCRIGVRDPTRHVRGGGQGAVCFTCTLPGRRVAFATVVITRQRTNESRVRVVAAFGVRSP